MIQIFCKKCSKALGSCYQRMTEKILDERSSQDEFPKYEYYCDGCQP